MGSIFRSFKNSVADNHNFIGIHELLTQHSEPLKKLTEQQLLKLEDILKPYFTGEYYDAVSKWLEQIYTAATDGLLTYAYTLRDKPYSITIDALTHQFESDFARFTFDQINQIDLYLLDVLTENAQEIVRVVKEYIIGKIVPVVHRYAIQHITANKEL